MVHVGHTLSQSRQAASSTVLADEIRRHLSLLEQVTVARSSIRPGNRARGLAGVGENRKASSSIGELSVALAVKQASRESVQGKGMSASHLD